MVLVIDDATNILSIEWIKEVGKLAQKPNQDI